MKPPKVMLGTGSKVAVVRLRGDRKNPEPESFRVLLPFGDVDIVRCDDDSYWIHVRRNKASDFEASDDGEGRAGRLMAGRVDVSNKSASESDAGDFENPRTYHVAVRIGAADHETEFRDLIDSGRGTCPTTNGADLDLWERLAREAHALRVERSKVTA